MPRPSIVAVFCDDIREEVQSTFSIVGVMPDNLQIGALPSVIPKMGVFVRANFDPYQKYGEFSIKLALPTGEVIDLHQSNAADLEKQQAESREKGSPHVGMAIRAVYAPVVIPSTGRITVTYNQEGEEPFICGSLNLTLDPPTPPKTYSIGHPQRSGQSSSDTPPSMT